jgi:DNA-binding transcriptional ArsR family regulator
VHFQVAALQVVEQSAGRAYGQVGAVLEGAGLLTRERDGRVHRIGLAPEPLRNAADWISHYRRFWDDRLDALGEFLETIGPDEEEETR